MILNQLLLREGGVDQRESVLKSHGDYKEQDKASSTAPQPDTEDQPVSVCDQLPLLLSCWATFCSVLLLLLLSRGCPKKAASSDNQETTIY